MAKNLTIYQICFELAINPLHLNIPVSLTTHFILNELICMKFKQGQVSSKACFLPF